MMDAMKQLQIATTKADIILGIIIRGLAVVALSAAFFVALIVIRRWAGFEGYDPYYIDYNRPGIDITSEGPENDVPWELGGEAHADTDAHL